jgi:ubiquitin-like 1-activating enzyme E1 A
MDHQPDNGVGDGSTAPITAPIPATNGGTAGLNPELAAPDAMAAAMLMSGQAFIPDPSLGTTAISDPSIMAPMMFSNGHAAAGLALPDKAITAGKTNSLRSFPLLAPISQSLIR